MARPSIRYAAAGTQAASSYGLAGSWPCAVSGLGDRDQGDFTRNALGHWDETRSALGWTTKLGRRYDSRGVGGGVGARYMGVSPDLKFYSGGVPSQNQPGLAAVFPDSDFTDAPLGLGSWGQTSDEGESVRINYRDPQRAQIADEPMSTSIRIGERPIGDRPGPNMSGTFPKGLASLRAIINPSDEYVNAVQNMGAWPGGGVVTDMYASLSPDSKGTVDDLVRQGVQLYDAIKTTIRNPAPVQPASTLGTMAPMLLLGGAAYLLLSGRRRGRRR